MLLISCLTLLLLIISACSSTDTTDFSLKEGIAKFSMQYPSDYRITHIDITNDAAVQYTAIMLRSIQASAGSIAEFSIHVWPVDEVTSSSTIMDDTLYQASSLFPDYSLVNRAARMIGGIESQEARFSWIAVAEDSAPSDVPDIAAVSTIICFRYNNLAWQIHLAMDADSQSQADEMLSGILDSFHILS